MMKVCTLMMPLMMELFPQERLLYLSPDSRTDLVKYDSDDIYIIGGLVDGATGIARTLADAKRNEIRHARLPMRKHIG